MLGYERAARAAAARAGALLRARYRERHEISLKGDVDIVTATDRDAEKLIVEALSREFPDHGIVAEESPASRGRDEHCWYVDPIDGTTNFAHGYPHFAVSIGLARAEEVIFGLVYDPVREETFTAVRGGGACLNGVPVRVSAVSEPDRALLATGFPYDRRLDPEFYLAFWSEAIRRAQCIRRSGSAALDLCYVACGRLDGFWEWNLRPWDVAAGRVIVEEAGGQVSDFDGGPHRLAADETAASNGRLHAMIVELIRAGRLRLGRDLPASTRG